MTKLDSAPLNPLWSLLRQALVWLVLCLAAVLLASCGADNPGTAGGDFSYQVRVINGATNRFVERARVMVEVQGLAPLSVLSDNNGLARLMVGQGYAGRPGRLIVDASGFEPFVQNIDLDPDSLPAEVVLVAATPGTPTAAPAAGDAATPVFTPAPTDQPASSTTVAPTATTLAATSPPATASPADQTTLDVRGSVAQGGTKDYRFIGAENVPVIITTVRGDDLRFYLELLDPNGGVAFTTSTLGPNAQTPFTPQMDGEHTVRLVGNGGFGDYMLKLEPLEPEQVAGGEPLALEPGARVEGKVATGASDNYLITLTENVPMIITTVRGDDLRFYLELLDPNGGVAFTTSTLGPNTQTPFTPQMNGEHTVRLVGNRGFGDYTLKLEPLEPEQAAGGEPLALEPGAMVEGKVATGASDNYLITLTENVPVIITTVRGDDLRFYLELLDPNGGVAFTTSTLGPNAQTPFTPQMDGEHTVRLVGNGGFGGYTITLGSP